MQKFVAKGTKVFKLFFSILNMKQELLPFFNPLSYFTRCENTETSVQLLIYTLRDAEDAN
jgi:hypothetical protein